MVFFTGEPKSNGQIKVHDVLIEGSNYVELVEEIRKAKERLKLNAGCRVVRCYEAGQDGFWPHRKLTRWGATIGWSTMKYIYVFHPAGLPSAVQNRSRRFCRPGLKSIVASAGPRRTRWMCGMLKMLVRSQKGEGKIWKEVRVPSVEEGLRQQPLAIGVPEWRRQGQQASITSLSILDFGNSCR